MTDDHTKGPFEGEAAEAALAYSPAAELSAAFAAQAAMAIRKGMNGDEAIQKMSELASEIGAQFDGQTVGEGSLGDADAHDVAAAIQALKDEHFGGADSPSMADAQSMHSETVDESSAAFETEPENHTVETTGEHDAAVDITRLELSLGR